MPIRNFLRSALLGLCFVSSTSHAAILWSAAPYVKRNIQTRTSRNICDAISRAADQYELPRWQLARLLWQESHFGVNIVRTDGNLGIAKLSPFIPEARYRNLFEYHQAIDASAAYLNRLRGRFGDLKSAVAAYELGEDTFATWKAAGGRKLPTRADNLVFEVTGPKPAKDEHLDIAYQPSRSVTAQAFMAQCQSLPSTENEAQATVAYEHRWAAIVAGNWCREAVENRWKAVVKNHPRMTLGLQPSIDRWVTPLGGAGVYAARIYTSSRADADQVCRKLHAIGSPCVVLRN